MGDDLSLVERGVNVIRSYLSVLPMNPGVYRMISVDGEVLYVGKAKSLKSRVRSYTNFEKLPYRLQNMVSLTSQMEFINTETEAEALILEANLIKKHKTRFNILLRDDKSFPYIVVRDDHDYPQILKHRGAKNISGKYFGPFPSAGDVNRTLAILQKAFLLRNCSDSDFSSRNRACLQYHIKRCTAPCVGSVSGLEYAEQVKGVRDFMDGKSEDIKKELAALMDDASNNMDFERAALYRDRIQALSTIQAKQDIDDKIGDVDVIAISRKEGVSCIQVFFYRAGRNLGNKSFFPRHDKNAQDQNILSAFLVQFYHNKTVPKAIVMNVVPSEIDLISEALSRPTGVKVQMSAPSRGKYKKALDFAYTNSCEALKRHLSLSATRLQLRKKVADIFELDEAPTRIEVYDNSHISGTNMVGAMIVEGEEGFDKKAYRKFNIRQASASDDYGMMREVFTRRFRLVEEGGNYLGSGDWPDLILVDGGLGQLNACLEILDQFGIRSDVTIVAIAKGEDRNAGREKFFMPDREMFQLPINDPVLHYLERLRDEAHRFAIGSHRARRSRDITKSPLDNIDGIGAKRKKALLTYFGSAKSVQGAAIEDLQKVEGISDAVARTIYDYFHES